METVNGQLSPSSSFTPGQRIDPLNNDNRAVMVRVPPQVFRRLRVAAAYADMSISSYVARLVIDAQVEASNE